MLIDRTAGARPNKVAENGRERLYGKLEAILCSILILFFLEFRTTSLVVHYQTFPVTLQSQNTLSMQHFLYPFDDLDNIIRK